jgi:hypothetical protein
MPPSPCSPSRCCTWRSVAVGSVVTAPLEGSLLVVFIFLLDAFAGPGVSGGSAPPWAVSEKAADILIAAGMGTSSPAGDWVKLTLVTGGALMAAFLVFVASARSRA